MGMNKRRIESVQESASEQIGKEMVTGSEEEDNFRSCENGSQLKQIFRKILVFMTIVSFLFIGFFINVLQLLLVVALQISDNVLWRYYIKKVSSALLHVFFAPVIFLFYYWSNMSLNIQLGDVKLIEDNKKPILAVVVPNHSYELDYMICFALADQIGNLGSYKSMSKDELKYIPIAGWALWMSDIIFVKRKWSKDKLSIGRKLDQLYDYDQSALGIFAEGTRWTREKHEASVKFAREKGMEPLKYHLLPRTRGFNYAVRHYLRGMIVDKRKDENLFRILNMEFIMSERTKFTDWLNGRQLKVDVYCEEVEVSREIREEIVKSKNEDECPKLTQLLYDIYRRKDQLVEDYKENGNKFVVDPKRGGPFPLKRRPVALIIWLLGFGCTYSTLGYLAVVKYVDSYTFWTLLVTFIGGCVWMLKRIEYESDVKNSSLKVKPENDNNSDNNKNRIEKISSEKFIKSTSPAF